MARNYLTSDQKKIIINKRNEGYSLQQISESEDIPKSSIFTFLRRKKISERNNNNLQRIGRPYKINLDLRDYIIDLVENNSLLTLKEIKNKIGIDKNEIISEPTIFRLLIREKIIRKWTQLVSINRNSEITIQKEQIFFLIFNIYSNTPIYDLMHIDESGFNLHIKYNYGRKKVGIPSVTVVLMSIGKNISLLQAINNKNVIYFEIYSREINFIQKLKICEKKMPFWVLIMKILPKIIYVKILLGMIFATFIPHS